MRGGVGGGGGRVEKQGIEAICQYSPHFMAQGGNCGTYLWCKLHHGISGGGRCVEKASEGAAGTRTDTLPEQKQHPWTGDTPRHAA